MMAIADDSCPTKSVRPHELGDLLRDRPLDLLQLPAIVGDVRAQQADREEVLVSSGAARLTGQQMAERLLMKYPRLGIHEFAHEVPPFLDDWFAPHPAPRWPSRFRRRTLSKFCATGGRIRNRFRGRWPI